MKSLITSEVITKLNNNEVFVFGSNIQGEHVGGAALVAKREFGAIEGQGFGLQGQTYAIPTCCRYTNEKGMRYTKPFAKVSRIKPFVDVFIDEAKEMNDLLFLVTKIGCGIAGLNVEEIAELFRPCLELDNVALPKEFYDVLLKGK